MPELRYIIVLLFVLSVVFLPGCGLEQAARAKIEYADLKVNVDDPYPITVDSKQGDTVYLRVSDRTGINLEQNLTSELTQRLSQRLKLVANEDDAKYILRIDISDKIEDKSAREVIGGGSDGGAVVGTAGGALAGAASGGLGAAAAGAGIGLVVGGVSDLASSMVKVGEAKIFCTVNIKQRLPQAVTTETKTKVHEGSSSEEQNVVEESNFKRKNGKFTVSAKKSGLTPAEAVGPLAQAIAKETAGIF